MSKIVMILTNLFRPDVRVYKEAKYLIEKGHEVEILCWDRENEFLDSPKEEIDGIKVTRFYPYSVPGTGLFQLKSYIKFVKKCKKYLRNQECDYLHCHDLDGIIAGIFVKSKNAKLVFDMHEYYEAKRNGKLWGLTMKRVVRYLQNKSDFIIYVNRAQKVNVSENNKKKMYFLPNYPVFHDFRDTKKTVSDKLRISYIGVVRQFEQLKNLMDACNDFTDVAISIHGSGIHYHKLKELEHNYKNVNITGPYLYHDSYKLYNDTDISYIIYPMNNYQNSIGEPVKYFEAIITKTPIIISNEMKLAKDILNNEIGFTVNGDDVNDIRNLVYRIKEKRISLKEKMNNLDLLKSCYCWEEVVKVLDDIYPKS